MVKTAVAGVTVTVTEPIGDDFPPIPPYLGELMVENGYGVWSWAVEGDVSLVNVSSSILFDTRKGVANKSSIKLEQSADITSVLDTRFQYPMPPSIHRLAALRFVLTTPLDLSKYERVLFTHYVEGFDTACYIMLIDASGGSSVPLNFTGTTTWIDANYLSAQFMQAGFDHTSVKEIWFIPYWLSNPSWPKNLYVDWLYFKAKAAVSYNILIYSKPSGKSGTINGQPFTTPVTTLRGSSGTYNIIIEETDFLYWEDLPTDDPQRTNWVRSLEIVDKSVTITAVYAGAPPPTPCPFHAAYLPSHDHPDLLLARRFRDLYVSTRARNIYYRYSPFFTPWVSRSKRRQQLVRALLHPIVKVLSIVACHS